MYRSEDGRVCIAGDGLLGTAFRNLRSERNCLVIASGVSNSQARGREPFLRERALVTELLDSHRDHHVLYFSTCSIDGNVSSAYIDHKLEMEGLVHQGAPIYTVFRLPQVVGVVRNTTIVSYFVDRIQADEFVPVQTNATRNLIDVRDVVRIVEALLPEEEAINSVKNIAAAEGVNVLDIVMHISRILGKDPVVELSEMGDNQTINIDFMKRHLPSDDVVLAPLYWQKVLDYYVPKIAIET